MSYQFTNFCTNLNDLCKTNSKESKQEIIKNILRQCDDNSDEVFAYLRLMLPQNDKTRSTYGLKEHSLGKIFVKLFDLDQENVLYQQLCINEYPEVKRPKDFATIVYQVLQECRRMLMLPSDLTIKDINEYLDRISSEAHKFPIFQELINILPPNDIKWLVRIILKEVRFGLDPILVLSAFNPTAAELFKTTTDLCQIISKTLNQSVDDEYLFQFIRPMLSIKASKRLLTPLNLSGYLVEEKFDGERFQLHYTKTNYKWYSRQGNIIESNFDQLTKQIEPNISENVNNLVLDGEMVGYCPKTRKYGTKGFNYDIKKVKDTSYYQACFIVFDILVHNSHNVQMKGLKDRKKLIEEVIKDKEGILMKSKVRIISTVEELVDSLNESVKKDLEGIVIKHPDSVYLPNQRTSSWIKVKIEYFDGLLIDLDLAIIGGYYGDGRHAGKVGTFMLGVLDQNQYVSIGESGLGLTDYELQKLQYKLNPHWQKGKPSASIKFGKKQPDVWIDPKHSVILEMKASELHRGDSFVTSHTLRFPRILKVRYDKPIDNCMSLEEFNELLTGKPVVKLSKRLAAIEDLIVRNIASPKKKKVKRDRDLLGGRLFVALSESENLTIAEVCALVVENGGKVCSTWREGVVCMLAGKIDFMVETQMKAKEKKDVVKLDWLLRMIQDGAYKDWHPKDALVISEQKKKEFNVVYDKYYDHFTEHLTMEGLEEVLKNVPGELINFW